MTLRGIEWLAEALYVLTSYVHPSIRRSINYQTCKHDILSANEPISIGTLQIGTRGSRDMDMK